MKSKNSLFKGMRIKKPKLATMILDAKGEPIYECPYCHKHADIEACDVIGAEDGCVFCNECNREFEMP